MVKLVFKINPIVNLFYHLEKGGLSKRYVYAPVEEYRQKALRTTERVLLDNFSFLLDQENVHSVIIRAMGGSDALEKANENLVTALNTYANELTQIMRESWRDYLKYFQDYVKLDLEKFRENLQQLAPEIEEALIKLEDLLNLHWCEKYVIYIVEPTSINFKPCGGAIYGEGAVIEAHRDLKTNDIIELPIHELSHITFDLTILRSIPEKLRRDFECVDEAIIFLIVNALLNYLKAPPIVEKYKDERSKKTAFYAIQFWEKWQNRINSKIKEDTFEDFLIKLLRDDHLCLYSQKEMEGLR